MNGERVFGNGNPPSRAGLLPAMAAGLAMCIGGPAASRADRIDKALIGHAHEVTDFLVKKNCKNVGVLRFRLQKGDRLPEFRGGLIVNNLCDRLQDALVFSANPEAPPIGIIDHAGSVAVKKLQMPGYRTPADRKKLFTIKYPLMWGDPPDQVVPDIFLTGKVAVSSDFGTCTVTIEAFDRVNPGTKLTPVTQFTVKPDRFILADLGQGYSVKKMNPAAFQRGMSTVRDIIEDSDPPPSVERADQEGSGSCRRGGRVRRPERFPAGRQRPRQVVSVGGAPGSPFPVAWTVFYDGVAQAPSADPDNPGNRNFVIPDPQAGQKVTFGVKNLSGAAVGLVLTVNGVSTLYGMRDRVDKMPPWILEPGKEFLIKGCYQQDGQTYIPIVGFPEEQTAALLADLGDETTAGLIHIHIIGPGTSEQSQITLSRSMSPSAQVMGAEPARSIADLQRRCC